uniref:Phosphoribosylformylglycinamidine synthase n=1 Tax=Paulinella micropora TaxID=1928728 RepID=A0A1L5YBV3_9EUKA|nr:phosphoribosylformylglycinamidine synthase [Paulinella micropora]
MKGYPTPFSVFRIFDKEDLIRASYNEMVRRLKRKPNPAELDIFEVLWCKYSPSCDFQISFQDSLSSDDSLLNVQIQNTGIVDLGKGQSLVLGMESYSPLTTLGILQRTVTCINGVLAGISLRKAHPIALLDTLRIGPLEKNSNIDILQDIVAEISYCGQSAGVPIIGGKTSLDDIYDGNPLVNVMAIGLTETDAIVGSGKCCIGSPIIYISCIVNHEGIKEGDPFLKSALIEAYLEAFTSGNILFTQHIGTFIRSCAEMAIKGHFGIEIDLDRIPIAQTEINLYEFLLSEYEETMILAVCAGQEESLLTCFRYWGLQALVIGRVLKESVVRVLNNGKVIVEVPSDALTCSIPVTSYKLFNIIPDSIKKHWEWTEIELPQADCTGITPAKTQNKLSWGEILLILLDSVNITSKRWVWRQYDYQIQSNTVTTPGNSDASVLRLRSQIEQSLSIGQYRGIAVTLDCPNHWVALDPERGSIAAVAEAARNLTCAGAEPLAIINNLTSALSEPTIAYWQLAMSSRGISLACSILNIPIVNSDTLPYNETNLYSNKLHSIYLAPVVGMVGLIHNLCHVTSLGWIETGDSIWLLGVPLLEKNEHEDRVSLGGSSYLESVHSIIIGRPPRVDLLLEYRVQKIVRQAIISGIIHSAHSLSDGGLTVAVAESCIVSGLGAYISLSYSPVRLDRLLFGEGGARILVSISKRYKDKWKKLLEIARSSGQEIPAECIGMVTDNPQLIIEHSSISLLNLSIYSLTSTYEEGLPRRTVQQV